MEKIKISDELSNYIESLHYETNALQDLLTKINLKDVSEDIKNFWYNKYIEKYTSYNLAKQELEAEYVIPKFGKNHSWNLDFSTAIVEVQ